MMNLNTFFFDLGGVLIDFSHEKMCKNIADHCDIPVELVEAHLFEKEIGELYERGEIDDDTLFSHFSQLSGRPIDFDGLMHAVSDIFTPKPEMPPLLEALKRDGYKLYLLSNTCQPHFSFIKKNYRFLDLFDGYILSYQQRARKPEKKIYDAALEMADSDPGECFYTDDVSAYTYAAQSYGIDSHLFEGAESLKDTLENRGIKIL